MLNRVHIRLEVMQVRCLQQLHSSRTKVPLNIVFLIRPVSCRTRTLPLDSCLCERSRARSCRRRGEGGGVTFVFLKRKIIIPVRCKRGPLKAAAGADPLFLCRGLSPSEEKGSRSGGGLITLNFRSTAPNFSSC